MTRLLLVAFPLLLSSCEFDGLQNDRFREDFHMNYKLQPGQRVSVENMNGSVEVSGWDKDEVDISGERYAPTEEYLRLLKVDVQASSASVRIRTVRPPQMGWRGPSGGVKYFIRVPKKTILDRIESTNGALRVEDVEGNATLRSTNGGIRTYRASGNYDVHTTNGGIEFSVHAGDVKAHTTNGGIRVEELNGSLNAETTNGQIHARVSSSVAQPMRLSTTNGGIEMTLEKMPSGLTASTTNGGITLRLPTDLKASVRASSNSGISTDFPVSGEVEKKRVRGTINGGGPVLDLSTTHGRIRLERL